jgi:hypothetical protein
VVLSDWSYSGFPSAQAILAPIASSIYRRGGVKNKDTQLNTTSSKDESFPSKERPLLGRLESRKVREGFVSMWMLCSSFRIK